MSKGFQEIKVGDKADFSVEITEELHASFAALSGDHSVIHTDETFSKRLGYAYLLTSFLSRLYGEHLPGGTSICIKQEVQFVNPYFVGDTITVLGEVTEKIESTRFVEMKVSMQRQCGTQVLRGKGVVQVNFTPQEVTPLYEGLYQKDFVDALKALGIKEEDTLFVHADIISFGKLRCFDRKKLSDALVGALKKAAHTIIMPTFTYSFCKGECFNVEYSPSTVGTLTEHFRKMPDSVRSLHPIFSVSISGDTSLQAVGKDSFDKDSIFGKLHAKKGKLLFFGAPFQSCTFIHYVEQMHGVKYRYMKTFEGTIKTADREYNEKVTYFVRDLEKKVNLDLLRLEKHLIQKGLMKEARLGEGRLLVIDAEALFDEGSKLLAQDPYYFLHEKPE